MLLPILALWRPASALNRGAGLATGRRLGICPGLQPRVAHRKCSTADRRPGPASKVAIPVLRMYTGPQCSLCDDIRQVIGAQYAMLCSALRNHHSATGSRGDSAASHFCSCSRLAHLAASVTAPHQLEVVDIYSEPRQHYYHRYKWDIPVLHIDGKYYTKHRTTARELQSALEAASSGDFKEREGEPDSSAFSE